MSSTYRFVENMDGVLGITTEYNRSLSDQAFQKMLQQTDHADVACGELNAFYGLKHTQDTKKKMSKAAKARPCNRKGVALSKETKKLISKNNASKKAIKTPNGIFESKVEAAEALGTTTESIRTVLNEMIDQPVRRKSKLFTKDQVGKTPREIGWDYV